MIELRRRAFARVYDLIGPRLTRATREQRARLVADLEGRVLEVGCGPGNNFAFYAPDLEVVATDASAPMLRRAALAAATAAASVTVEQADVQTLPYADGSFDGAVGALVLCSVDQPAALGELRRVLRPGGTLRLWEHVRSERTSVATLQRLANPAWGLLADGCHLDRDTVEAVRRAGFELESVERFGGAQPAHVLIVARRPS